MGEPPTKKPRGSEVFLLGASKPIVWLTCVTRVECDVLLAKPHESPVAALMQFWRREGAHRPQSVYEK